MTPKRPRAVAALGALLLASGCAVGPNFVRPAPPAVSAYLPPDRTVDLGGQRISPGAAAEAAWWRRFGSSRLDGLIAEAIKGNSDWAAAKAALTAAHQTYLAQAGALFPTLDASAASSRNKSSNYLSPVLNAQQFYYSLQTAQLNLSYTLDLFGGLRRQVEGAKAQEEAQRFQTEGAYVTLVSNVVVGAVQEASCRRQLEAQEEIIKLEREILKVMRRQLELGQIAGGDVLAQDAAVAQAEAALPPLQKQLALQQDLMAYLLGRAPGEGLAPSLDLDALVLPSDLPVSLPSSLVAQRPDIRVAEANLHAASAAVGVAAAARLPAITLFGASGGNGGAWSNIFSGGDDFWSFGVGAAQPIFQGGALYRKQKAAQAALEQARQLYKSAVLSAFQNVADVLQSLEADQRALTAAQAAQKAALASFQIAKAQVQQGQTNALTVLNAEQALRSAEMTLIQARATRLTDTAALFQAVGGGWWDRPGSKSS